MQESKDLVVNSIPVAKSEFDIPAAPILIPKGPWKAVDGSVNAPKGFKAQGSFARRHMFLYTAITQWQAMPAETLVI